MLQDHQQRSRLGKDSAKFYIYNIKNTNNEQNINSSRHISAFLLRIHEEVQSTE
jgi:hypothetical protein